MTGLGDGVGVGVGVVRFDGVTAECCARPAQDIIVSKTRAAIATPAVPPRGGGPGGAGSGRTPRLTGGG
jgi:hypothetical protein